MRDHAKRLEAVERTLAEQDLDAIVIDEPANRRYLSGFTGSTGLAVVAPPRTYFITDSRYYERATAEAPDFDLVRAGYQIYEALASELSVHDNPRVGFEAEHVTVARLNHMKERVPDVEWVPVRGVLEDLRAIKDKDELDVIRRAADITDRAMEYAYQAAVPGMTERELAWQLEVFMREHGAEAVAFEIIVASGPNAAIPHHHSGTRALRTGDVVLIDMGARVDGYNADLTRTFSLGPASDESYSDIWDLVARANQAAIDAIRPGMTGKEADSTARDVIAEAGYGEEFGHSLGHGVGLHVHELPRVSSAAEEATLAAGMVVTIEPGVYLPGRFGVRIEDLAVIHQDGVEVLSHAEKKRELDAG